MVIQDGKDLVILPHAFLEFPENTADQHDRLLAEKTLLQGKYLEKWTWEGWAAVDRERGVHFYQAEHWLYEPQQNGMLVTGGMGQ